MADSEYISQLRAYPEKFSEGRWAIVPRVYKDNECTVLDREATAALPCYAGMEEVGHE